MVCSSIYNGVCATEPRGGRHNSQGGQGWRGPVRSLVRAGRKFRLSFSDLYICSESSAGLPEIIQSNPPPSATAAAQRQHQRGPYIRSRMGTSPPRHALAPSPLRCPAFACACLSHVLRGGCCCCAAVVLKKACCNGVRDSFVEPACFLITLTPPSSIW